MSENTTRNLPDDGARSFEERIFARFDAMDARFNSMDMRFDGLERRLGGLEKRLDAVETRLTTFEDKVDARLRETRPIWEGVQARLTTIEATLEDISRQFQEVILDLLRGRARVARLEERERPPVA